MKKFKTLQRYLFFLLILNVFFIMGCGGGTGHWSGGNSANPSGSAKAIITYSLDGISGTVNESAKTIAVTVPNGTNVTAMIATFTTTGTTVKVGAVVQTSGTTANNFTAPVEYNVTAADGSTTATPYTVTVTVASASAKAITAYSFKDYAGYAGVINEVAKTIEVNLPNGTNVTALVANFTTTGTSVKIGAAVQTSGTTANNFTGPVAYIVTAADASTATYTVTVTVAASSAKAITAYSFAGYTGATGTIDEAAKTIAVTVPNGTDVTTLVATFTTTGTSVKVGGVEQTSGTTANNFTNPVAYIVTAADATTATYTVTVTVAAASAKAITAYSFAGYTGATGTINETAKTIRVTVPFGTNVTALVATFTTTGTVVKVGTTVQTSAATANNFTAPVEYIVTAADATTATYTVTVTVAANSAKAITAYSFAGYTGATGTIDETAKTIAVTVPNGTNVTALVATFTTTGSSVKVGGVEQTSASTANNFTAPVAYLVTAADATTATYTVTVTVAASSAKAITAYSFVGYEGYAGTIDEAAKTIDLNLPNGTNVTALIAKFTTTGASVKVGTTVQVSSATANDFTNPVAYIVTAADASTATYTVTVLTTVPNLGRAAPFGGFGGNAGMTNEGVNTVINNGDIGTTGVSTMMTGFHDMTGDEYTQTPLNIGNVKDGRIYTDAPPPTIFIAGGPYGGTAATKKIADDAAADALAAYNYLAGLPGGAFAGAGELGGLTLTAGTYTSTTSFKITNGDLTLSGGPNDVWVFQMGSSLTVGDPTTPRSVLLTGGAQSKNVFWQVASAGRIEDKCTMVGTIIAKAGITISTAGQAGITTLNGRAQGLDASVTMVNTVINIPAH